MIYHMRSPYTKAKVAYISVWALVAILILFIWVRNESSTPSSLISTLLALAIGFFTSRLLENLVSSTETTRNLGYLHMELDPEKFIASYSPVPQKTRKGKDRMISYAYLSSGYEAKGDFQKALETLEKGEIGGSDSLDTLYLSSKCRYLLEGGKIEEAKAVLKALEERIEKIQDNEKLKDNQKQVAYILSERIEVEEGGKGDEEYLEGRLKCSQYKIGRLEILSAMALHYRNAGKRDKEKEMLNRIIKEGGKTWYTAWAEKRLKP